MSLKVLRKTKCFIHYGQIKDDHGKVNEYRSKQKGTLYRFVPIKVTIKIVRYLKICGYCRVCHKICDVSFQSFFTIKESLPIIKFLNHDDGKKSLLSVFIS